MARQGAFSAKLISSSRYVAALFYVASAVTDSLFTRLYDYGFPVNQLKQKQAFVSS